MSSTRHIYLKRKKKESLLRLLKELNNTWEFFRSKSVVADKEVREHHALVTCKEIVTEANVLTNMYNTVDISYDFRNYKFIFTPDGSKHCRRLDGEPIKFEFYWNGNSQSFLLCCNADTELSLIPDYVMKPVLESITHLILHSAEWAETIKAILEGKKEELAAEEFPEGLTDDID